MPPLGTGGGDGKTAAGADGADTVGCGGAGTAVVAYRGGGDRAVGLGTGAVAYYCRLVAYLLPRGVAARAV